MIANFQSHQYFVNMYGGHLVDFSHVFGRPDDMVHVLLGTEAHDSLYAGPVVPASVKDHDFGSCWKMGQVSLDIHLGLFAFRWGRQRDHAERSWAYAVRDRLDHPSFSGSFSTLEDDADLFLFVPNPLLKLHKFDVQSRKLAVVVLFL